MSIFRVQRDKENPYVQLHKKLVYDKTLSFKAKGILVYLLSRPDDWKVYESEIIKHSKDGKDSVRSGIKELINSGYVLRSERRTEDGKFGGYEYDVFEQPTPERIIRGGKTEAVKPFSENLPLLINDVTNNELTNGQNEFDLFWNKYPRKVKKKYAETVFKTTRKNHSLETILQGVEKYDKHLKENKTNSQYVMHPSSFLNSEAFLDEYKAERIESQPKPQPKEETFGALAGIWGEEYE